MLEELKQSYISLLDAEIAHNEYKHIQIAMIYVIKNYKKKMSLKIIKKTIGQTKIIPKNNNSAMIDVNRKIIFTCH